MVRFYLVLFIQFIVFIGALSDSRLPNKQNISSSSSISPTPSEQSRVQKIIGRLESSSSSSSSNTKAGKKTSTKKSFHEDHSEGQTSFSSSPPVKRVARRDSYDKSLTNGNHSNNGESFVIPRDNPSTIKSFELEREERTNRCRRTASGTTVSLF
jgi:hypothetical protein